MDHYLPASYPSRWTHRPQEHTIDAFTVLRRHNGLIPPQLRLPINTSPLTPTLGAAIAEPSKIEACKPQNKGSRSSRHVTFTYSRIRPILAARLQASEACRRGTFPFTVPVNGNVFGM
jgi:hypothetical protein